MILKRLILFSNNLKKKKRSSSETNSTFYQFIDQKTQTNATAGFHTNNETEENPFEVHPTVNPENPIYISFSDYGNGRKPVYSRGIGY